MGVLRVAGVGLGALALAALVAACSRDEPAPASGAVQAPVPEPEPIQLFDTASILRGNKLFQEHCAQCHGPHAQGHPDWETPSDGRFAAAPPLDGTGNDWKRSKPEIVKIIRNGVRRANGDDIMPAFRGRLSERDVQDVITWFQSLWPPEVYDTWNKAQSAPPAPKG
jgi:mono/diheme cytochrome c family protein